MIETALKIAVFIVWGIALTLIGCILVGGVNPAKSQVEDQEFKNKRIQCLSEFSDFEECQKIWDGTGGARMGI